MELSSLPLGLVLMLGLLGVVIYALTASLKYYGLPLVKSRRRRRQLEELLLRVSLVLWLVWAVFAFYRLLLASPVFALALTTLLAVLSWSWWADFYPGLLFKLEGDICPGDHLNYEGKTYQIQAMRARSLKLIGEDGGVLVLPYRLLRAPAIYQSVEKTALAPFTFEVECEGPNALQRLEQLLAASPWTAPAYPAKVVQVAAHTYRITAYAPDEQIQQRQEQYIRQQMA
ncbi:MAG: hypothetical protein RIC19_05165 [Phaeodactylibacter sp.]|uniref:hypothetical protein n=1 Tax=Phaeodactylibacter sp. TaxID=1940289 RepID=UPI0032EABCE9